MKSKKRCELKWKKNNRLCSFYRNFRFSRRTWTALCRVYARMPHALPILSQSRYLEYWRRKEYTADELLDKAERFRPYWGDKGGITVSGGEPLLQIDF